MDSDGTFTYDSSLPIARDRVRHSLGDTDAANPLRWDETYNSLLEAYSEEAATAILARSLASEFAQQPSNVQLPGGLGVTFGDRVKTLLELASVMEKAALDAAASTGNALVDGRLTRDFEVDMPEYRRPLDAELEGSW